MRPLNPEIIIRTLIGLAISLIFLSFGISGWFFSSGNITISADYLSEINSSEPFDFKIILKNSGGNIISYSKFQVNISQEFKMYRDIPVKIVENLAPGDECQILFTLQKKPDTPSGTHNLELKFEYTTTSWERTRGRIYYPIKITSYGGNL